jgi:hypothetical protein
MLSPAKRVGDFKRIHERIFHRSRENGEGRQIEGGSWKAGQDFGQGVVAGLAGEVLQGPTGIAADGGQRREEAGVSGGHNVRARNRFKGAIIKRSPRVMTARAGRSCKKTHNRLALG